MSSIRQVHPLHNDKKFCNEANRFRKQADNAAELRQRLVELGHEEQAVLLDQLRWLKRPDKMVAVDHPLKLPTNIFGGEGQHSMNPFNFGTIPDEPVDAIEWLEALGALRLDEHFQCLWAACTTIVTIDGWSKDMISRRGRRWELRPPELLRAAFLLHWKDHRDAFKDWTRHIARLRSLASMNAVNDFTRMKMREDGFHRRIMPLSFCHPVNQPTEDKQVVLDDKIEFVRVLPTKYKIQFKEDANGL